MFTVELNKVNQKQRNEFIDTLIATSQGLDVKGTSMSVSVPAINTAEQLDAHITAELARPDGLRRIAFAMHPVLKRRLDYQAIGRNNILLVDELTPGDVPFYDIDLPEVGAVFVARNGQPIRQSTDVERIQFPTSNLPIVESVHYEELTIRRYPVFDRAKERAAIAIARSEDDAILSVNGVVHAATVVGPNTVVGANSLSRYVIAELGKRIVNQQLPFAAILMHPVQYAEIWKWSSAELDQVTLNRIVETGMVGTYLGARLLISTRCKKDSVYALTTADKLGRLPERKSVEVKVFDNVPIQRYDILAWEQVGFGIFNTAGVARADLIQSI